ncbi:MAG: hypothetical protein MUC28_00380 [Planctomycetes bacterium]|jgi:hypothetical protein|nr:hypothetical protein [Planctomycetota bacterium]
MITNLKYYFSLLLIPFLLTGCGGGKAADRLQWLDDKAGAVLDTIAPAAEEAVKEETMAEEEINTGNETAGKDPETAVEESAALAGKLTEEAKARIDVWLEENNLNHFGDDIDTMYTGGTPLFNEMTGETKDRYEYLLEKIPNILEKINSVQ